MRMGAYRDERPGIFIAYGNLLNSQRMKALAPLSTLTVIDLISLDECVLNTVSETEMQRCMDLFSAGCAYIGLTVITDKTVVMHQPPPNAAYSVLRVHFNGTQLQTMDNFVHLGSTLARCTKTNDEVAHRICKTPYGIAMASSQLDRRCQSQKGSSQVLGAPDVQHRRPTPPDMLTMSTNIPHTDRPCWISPDPVHQPPANSVFCLRVCTSSNTHDVPDDTHSHQRCSESPYPASHDHSHLHHPFQNLLGDDHHYYLCYRPKRSHNPVNHHPHHRNQHLQLFGLGLTLF
nr:unnamed protein product [Spirometra erinaceieuropaei]